MSVSVFIDVKGLQETLLRLGKIEEMVKDLTQENQDIGEYLLDFFSGEVFDSQGGTYGNPWAPLSEPYATNKAKKYGQQPILVATGQMRSAYKLYTASTYLLIKNEAINKQGKFYAQYHQEGTEKMPQRLLVDIDNERMQKILDIIENDLIARLNT